MSSRIIILAAAASLACGAPKALPPAVPAAAPPPPNLVVTAYEVVENPDQDGIALTRVYVDGQEAGRTEPGLKSSRKVWKGRVPEGNHPVRFERWTLDRISDWKKDDPAALPERFVRVRKATVTRVTLKYFDGGRRADCDVTQEPATSASAPP